MAKEFLKVLLIWVMFIAFVGQAIAFNSSVPCDSSKDPLSVNIDESLNHVESSHLELSHIQSKHLQSEHKAADTEYDCCGIDCCDEGCSCVTHVCSSFVYFNYELDFIYNVSAGNITYLQNFDQPTSVFTLLFRPPIFTS